jgi:hypothetical protein
MRFSSWHICLTAILAIAAGCAHSPLGTEDGQLPAKWLPPIRIERFSLIGDQEAGTRDVRLREPVAAAPDHLYVYSFQYPSLDDDDMRRIAADIFGIVDPFKLSNPDLGSYSLMDKTRLFVVSKRDNSFSYSVQGNEDSSRKEKLPEFSEDVAMKRAIEFLEKSKLGEKNVKTGRNTGRIRSGVLGKPETDEIVERRVRFEAGIDDYSIWGPGMYIDVGVLSNGQIGRFEKRWPTIGPERRACKTRTVREAFQFILSSDSPPLRSKVSGGKCWLERIVYVADDPYQKWIQPCYVLRIEKGKSMCRVLAPALADENYFSLPALRQYDEIPKPVEGDPQ